MSYLMKRLLGASLVVWTWLSCGPVAVRAQPPDEFGAAGEIVEEDLGEDIEALLAGAEEVFLSADQPDSIPLFERIILLLEQARAYGSLDEQQAEWLKHCLFRRAEARSNLLEREGATADLTAILRLDPAWEVPADHAVSRLLSELLSAVRDAETGVIDPLIEPIDAELLLDGELLDSISGPQRVLAGERRLLIRRPGYTQVEQLLQVPPGESTPVELVLERSSAVVRLRTRPAGVEVVYRDAVAATSQPREEGLEEETSTEVVVEGIALGEQILTLRKPGYRSIEMKIGVEELADYSLAPVRLERTRGTVVLSQVPATARVVLDGELHSSPHERQTGLQIEMPPGGHSLRVEGGVVGLFEHRFELDDRQVLELEVRLLPSLVLLGVLGDDRVAATDLERRLAERFGALSHWTLVEQAERGFELLQDAKIDRELLRGLAAESGETREPDWAALQGFFDRGLTGSAYLLAVLSDDLYASQADLWLWSAAPGPARPARRRIPLGREGVLDDLAAALEGPLRVSTPWLGARFIDSRAADSPLVLSVEPDGPAAAAGLEVGDMVTALGGQSVGSARQLTESIARLEAGSEVALEVGGAGEARSLLVTPVGSPVVAPLGGSSALDPALAARLVSLEGNADSQAPRWLVRLNLGAVLMRSGEWRRAAETLRGVEAPATAGVGKATVDYLLGIALMEFDPAAYRDTARGLLSQAADGGARLEHNDGPLLAARAKARLETLLPEAQP